MESIYPLCRTERAFCIGSLAEVMWREGGGC